MAKQAAGSAKKTKATEANPAERKAAVVKVEASRCPNCGSTEREAYYGTNVVEFAGIHDGLPYTHIINRRTACKTCGQHRIDRTYDNRKA